MGLISWYLFLFWFFWWLWVCVLWVGVSFLWVYLLWWNPPIWISTITIPLTIIPGLYCIWKSLNFASKLLTEEAKKSTKDIFIANVAFVISIGILYSLMIDLVIRFFPIVETITYLDSIFIWWIIIFLIFKIAILKIITLYVLDK